jgi:cytidylate kinase
MKQYYGGAIFHNDANYALGYPSEKAAFTEKRYLHTTGVDINNVSVEEMVMEGVTKYILVRKLN